MKPQDDAAKIWKRLNGLIENRPEPLPDRRNREHRSENPKEDKRFVLHDADAKMFYTTSVFKSFFMAYENEDEFALMEQVASGAPDARAEMRKRAANRAAKEYNCHVWSEAVGLGSYGAIELGQKHKTLKSRLGEKTPACPIYRVVEIQTHNILCVPEIEGVPLEGIAKPYDLPKGQQSGILTMDEDKRKAMLQEGYLQSMTAALIFVDGDRNRKNLLVTDLAQEQPGMTPFDFEYAHGTIKEYSEKYQRYMHGIVRNTNVLHDRDEHSSGWADEIAQRLDAVTRRLTADRVFCHNKDDLLRNVDGAQKFVAHVKTNGVDCVW